MGKRNKQDDFLSSLITKYLILIVIIYLVSVFMFSTIMLVTGLPIIMGVILGIAVSAPLIFVIVKFVIIRDLKNNANKIKKLNTSKNSIKRIQRNIKRKIILSLLICVFFTVVLSIIFSGVSSGLNGGISPYSIIEMLNKEKEAEEEKYNWGLDDLERFENEESSILGENGESLVSVSEAETLLEIAIREAEYYKNNKIRGGQKYWDWARSKDGSGGDWEWCATFVTYCVDEAGLFGDNGETFGQLWKNGRGVFGYKACEAWNNQLHKLGFERHYSNIDKDYKPKPADIILYHNGTRFFHIGIVEYTDDNGDIHTIEGNTKYYGKKNSIVARSNRYNMSRIAKSFGASYVVFYTPPYKVTQTGGQFTIGNYKKGADGYYSPEDTEKIMYDFFATEMGLNNAAVAGVLANLQNECSFVYDKMEAANDGKAYYSSSCTGNYLRVQSPSNNGNGTWRSIPDIMNTMQYTGKLYYRNSNGDCIKYGMGYGVVQWSFGRRVNLFNFAKDNGYGDGYGPDSLYAQLMFIKHELENSYKDVVSTLKSVPNNAAGARDAALAWASNYEKCKAEYRPARGTLAMNKYWPKYQNAKPSDNFGLN